MTQTDIDRWHEDPIAFAEEILGVQLDHYQRETILRRLGMLKPLPKNPHRWVVYP